MRVIAGTLRGRRLQAPRGRDTRPTSDRARESLFVAAGICMFLLIGYTEILFVDGRGMIGMVAYLWVGLAGAEALHGSTASAPVPVRGVPAC